MTFVAGGIYTWKSLERTSFVAKIKEKRHTTPTTPNYSSGRCREVLHTGSDGDGVWRVTRTKGRFSTTPPAHVERYFTPVNLNP